jgi:hypothetical protein
MADQDLQVLVQRLRSRAEFEAPGPALDIENTDCVPDVSWPEMAEIVTLMSDAADALELLSTRGTCNSCRFWFRNESGEFAEVYRVMGVKIDSRLGFCNKHEDEWPENGFCHRYEPQPTATEEAAK